MLEHGVGESLDSHYQPVGAGNPDSILPRRRQRLTAWRPSRGPWYPYIDDDVRMEVMEVSARLSSKGQVTVPRAVRDALALEQGDRLVFRVEGDHAVLARTADLLALAGSVTVPAAKRGTPWAEVLRQTRRTRAPGLR